MCQAIFLIAVIFGDTSVIRLWKQTPDMRKAPGIIQGPAVQRFGPHGIPCLVERLLPWTAWNGNPPYSGTSSPGTVAEKPRKIRESGWRHFETGRGASSFVERLRDPALFPVQYGTSPIPALSAR